MAPRIGLMLYSLSPEMAEDPAKTLQWVADCGFKLIELHRFTDNTETLRQLIAQHGFEHPTAHARPLGMSDEEQKRTFEAAASLGVETLIESKREAEYWQTPDDALKVAAHLNQVAALARTFGLKFGYHLHNHEVDITFDGQTAIEYVEPSLDPEMLIQVDAWWGTRGNADLAVVTRRLGTRVTTLHIKDGPAGTSQGQTAAGAGDVDLLGIVEAAPHARYATIEFDRSRFTGDIFKAISDGRDYLLAQGLQS
jgi:sugar phosphate isomerase/epimerase